MLVIGGGATGLGVAVDAARRGYATLLVEQNDFGKGTSSRSTKLVHGGVRYLEQGNISLVRDALRERGILRANAPHLVGAIPFVLPAYEWWEKPFYGIGLKLYQFLAGRLGFGPSRWLSREETLRRVPGLRTGGLRGGVLYIDGQFDDARFLVHLAATAVDHGAVVLNHARVTHLLRDGHGAVTGARFTDAVSGEPCDARARVVINATGPFVDTVRALADPDAPPLITPSRGTHIVLDRSFLPGDCAIIVPKTSDGRVMFAIPWRGHVLIGTTDVPTPDAALEPQASPGEIQFLLETAGMYLERRPSRADILSVFAGIRPLVRAPKHHGNTSAIPRDHTLLVDPSGMVTITGGKWTTYRRMAEECVSRAAAVAGLPPRPCETRSLRLHGWHDSPDNLGELAAYGADAQAIRALVRENPALGERLHPALPDIAAQVVWAVREELAESLEDVLGRRLRILFLNALAAIEVAPRAAELMAAELGRSSEWAAAQVAEFTRTARGYQP